MTTEIGVAAIPLSVFCADPFPHKLIRLCFAKQPAICWLRRRVCASCSYLIVHAWENWRPANICQAANLLQTQHFIGIHPQLFADFLRRPAEPVSSRTISDGVDLVATAPGYGVWSLPSARHARHHSSGRSPANSL